MFDQRFKIQKAFDDQGEGFDDFEQAIPLMSEEEEKKLTESEVPGNLPILPLKTPYSFRVLWYPSRWDATEPRTCQRGV
jgi:ATP-dependent Lon protease